MTLVSAVRGETVGTEKHVISRPVHRSQSEERRGERRRTDLLDAVVTLVPRYVGSDFILIFFSVRPAAAARSCTRMDSSPRKKPTRRHVFAVKD